MRLLVPLALSLVAGVAAQAQDRTEAPAPTPADLIAHAKELVTHDFRDPASAQFRDVAYFYHPNQEVVCGEVNGKNAYGAYVGFRRFVVVNDTVHMAKGDDKYFEQAVDIAWSVFCKEESSPGGG